MAQTPEGKVRSTYRKEILKYGVKLVVNYSVSQFGDTGHPDTTNLCDKGFSFYVELKGDLPNPSPQQHQYGTNLSKLGFLVYILGARGVAEIVWNAHRPDDLGEIIHHVRVKPAQAGNKSIQALTKERCKDLAEILLKKITSG